MLIVGLTGGIGSGKSTVAHRFVARGGGLVDTDAIAHRLTAPNGAALPALVAAFGPEILTGEAHLDRAALRRRVFSDDAERARLESILHPMIHAEAVRELGRLAAAALSYALLAIPLLVETGAKNPYPLDRVLVVDCPEAVQIARIMARSGLSEAEAKAILAAQTTREKRLALADDVIDNSGDLAAAEQQVERLHEKYVGLANDLHKIRSSSSF